MAARPHGADEPREGPIDEPLDEDSPGRASGPSASPDEPGGSSGEDPAAQPDDAAEDHGDAARGEPRPAEGARSGSDRPAGADDAAPVDEVDPDHGHPGGTPPGSPVPGTAVPGSAVPGSAVPDASREAPGSHPVDPERADGPVADSPGALPAVAPTRPADRSHDADDAADVDARWQEIIAQLADLDTEPAAPGRRESDGGTGPDVVRAADPGSTDSPPAGPAAPASAHRTWSPDPAVEEAGDHFEPPDPGPVLGGDPLLTMAWSVVVGVPVLFIAAVVLWRDIPTALLRAAAVAFVAGVGLLLWRMPHHRDDDDGPGAVV